MKQKKFGVIGHPIAHSLSKPMHEAVFKELNLPHTYDAIDVEPENLEHFIKTSQYDGLNVTIPHKIEVMKYLDEIKNEAKQIQAVNTISLQTTNYKLQTQSNSKNLIGDNTDWIGFQNSLKEEDVELQNKTVLVIGAGGASRAILISLKNNKANITLTNRTKEKAIALNNQLKLNAEIIDYNNESLKQFFTSHKPQSTSDPELIIVNTTSIGMHPNEDTSPIPKEFLKPNHIIFDVIYNPLKTKLIKDAEVVGCKTISGVNMLVHQGAQSLRIWLNIEPPIQTMRQTVLKNL